MSEDSWAPILILSVLLREVSAESLSLKRWFQEGRASPDLCDSADPGQTGPYFAYKHYSSPVISIFFYLYKMTL